MQDVLTSDNISVRPVALLAMKNNFNSCYEILNFSNPAKNVLIHRNVVQDVLISDKISVRSVSSEE